MPVSVRNVLWVLAFGVLLMIAEYSLSITSSLDDGGAGARAAGVERTLSNIDGIADHTDGREPSR